MENNNHRAVQKLFNEIKEMITDFQPETQEEELLIIQKSKELTKELESWVEKPKFKNSKNP